MQWLAPQSRFLLKNLFKRNYDHLRPSARRQSIGPFWAWMSRPSGCSCQCYKLLLLVLLWFAGAGSLAAQSLLSQPQELSKVCESFFLRSLLLLHQLLPPNANSLHLVQCFPTATGGTSQSWTLCYQQIQNRCGRIDSPTSLVARGRKEYYRLRIGAAQTDRSNVDSFASSSHYPRSRYRDQVFTLVGAKPGLDTDLEAAESIFVQDADSQQLRYWSLRGRTAENQVIQLMPCYRLEEARLLDNEQQKEFNKPGEPI